MKKAQFATEHILVIAIAMLIIIPVINMLYNYSQGQTDEMIVAQVQRVGNTIIDTSETIYYMGEPARITIDESFPDKIQNIVIKGNRELIFYIGDRNSSFPFLSEIPIDGPFYQTINNYCNETTVSKNACKSSGKKRIMIIAGNNNASIIIR